MIEPKSLIKRIVPKKVLAYRRLGSERTRFIKQIDAFRSNRPFNGIALIGTPLHENLGDHLITLGTRELLATVAPEKPVLEIPLEAYRLFWKKLTNVISKESIILINGGGWMGDDYPEDDRIIQHVVQHFPHNRIIVLPQTIHYQNKEKNQTKQEIQSALKVFQSASQFSLCLREKRSYQLAHELYPSIDSFLIPDMALAYWKKVPQFTNETSGRIGICLREDKERSLSTEEKGDIINSIQSTDHHVVMISTMAKQRVYSSEREKTVLKKLEEFSKCDLVITDRLHAMLFSFLAKTPCIAFDNTTKKVKGVYDTWLKDRDNIILLSDPNTIVEAFNMLKHKTQRPNITKKYFDFNFDVLKELILNG